MKETINRKIILPEKLINHIDNLGLSKTYRNKAFYICKKIINKSIREENNVLAHTDIPRNYFKKIIGSHYNKVVTPLSSSGVLERTGYVVGERARGYRISQVYFEKPKMKAVKIRIKDSVKENLLSDDERLEIISQLNRINIDRDAAIKFVKEMINKISIYEFKTNEQIEDALIQFKIKGKFYVTNKEKAIKIARSNNKTLIKDENGKFKIMSKNEFIYQKKINKAYQMYNSIEDIFQKRFYAIRNATNNRVDTNLTNLSGSLIKFLRIDNMPIKEIDLKNSQFSILSWVFEQVCKEFDFETKVGVDLSKFQKLICGQDDIERFKELSKEGTLYDVIAKEIGLDNRKIAKKAMFRIMFSSHKSHFKMKNKIKKLFPSVHNFITSFKKEIGDSDFPILLQKIEAYIFVDLIYRNMIKSGLITFTKHDSILCKEEDYDSVKSIVSSTLNSLNMQYSLN